MVSCGYLLKYERVYIKIGILVIILIFVDELHHLLLVSAFLVDTSQWAQKVKGILGEIVRIAKEQDLVIHISGAAESATGMNSINRRLSKERVKYIGKLLIKRGIEKEKLKAVSLGGINQFSPKEANRFVLVLLEENK